MPENEDRNQRNENDNEETSASAENLVDRGYQDNMRDQANNQNESGEEESR
jgi:hypothetical protein